MRDYYEVMKARRLAAILGLIVFGSACQQNDDANQALSSKIEKQLIAEHSDIDLRRFARFYAHGNLGSVSAVYLFANPDYDPMEGEAGKVYWVSTEEMPEVMDGGCSVINLAYNIITDTLISVSCNGEA